MARSEDVATKLQDLSDLVDMRILKSSKVPLSPLEVVLAPGKRDTVKGRRRTRQIRDGHKYGKLTVDKNDCVRTGRSRAYKCTCECGGVVHLIPSEIHRRKDTGLGCMRRHCTVTPLEVLVRRLPLFALELQLKTLLKADPEQVANEWSGTAYGEDASCDINEGIATLLHDLADKVNEPAGEWWMIRVNEALPYAAFNVVLISEPHINVFGSGGSSYIHYGANDYTVKDVARMFDLPTAYVRKLREEIFSDEELMKELINKGTQ